VLFDAFSGIAIRHQEFWAFVWMVHSLLSSPTLELNGGVSFRAVKLERFFHGGSGNSHGANAPPFFLTPDVHPADFP
jgi:hypothetical protein